MIVVRKSLKFGAVLLVPLALLVLFACGQNAPTNDLTKPTSMAGDAAISSPMVGRAPQAISTGGPRAVRTDIAQRNLPIPEATTIAVATEEVIRAVTATESSARTAVAWVTAQAIARRIPDRSDAVVIGKGDFGSWSYLAYQYPGELQAVIKYDTHTVDSLYAFAKVNQDLCKQLAESGGTAEVRIIFRSYVEPEQYRLWVKEKGLQVEESMLRATDIRPNYAPDISGLVRPEGGDPLPPNALESILEQRGNSIESNKAEKNIMRGVYFSIANVDAKRLSSIAEDPQVFIADVTLSIVRKDLKRGGVIGADYTETSDGVPTGVFWAMEHTFGLDKFRK